MLKEKEKKKKKVYGEIEGPSTTNGLSKEQILNESKQLEKILGFNLESKAQLTWTAASVRSTNPCAVHKDFSLLSV